MTEEKLVSPTAAALVVFEGLDERLLHSCMNSIAFQTEPFAEVVVTCPETTVRGLEDAIARYRGILPSLKIVSCREEDAPALVARGIDAVGSDYVLLLGTCGRAHEALLECASQPLAEGPDAIVLPIALRADPSEQYASRIIENERSKLGHLLSKTVANPYWGKLWKTSVLKPWAHEHDVSLEYYSTAPALLSTCADVRCVCNCQEPLCFENHVLDTMLNSPADILLARLKEDSSLHELGNPDYEFELRKCAFSRALEYSDMGAAFDEACKEQLEKTRAELEACPSLHGVKVGAPPKRRCTAILTRSLRIPSVFYIRTGQPGGKELAESIERLCLTHDARIVDLDAWAPEHASAAALASDESTRWQRVACEAICETGGIYVNEQLVCMGSFKSIQKRRAFFAKSAPDKVSMLVFGGERGHPAFRKLCEEEEVWTAGPENGASPEKRLAEFLVGVYGMNYVPSEQVVATGVTVYPCTRFLFPLEFAGAPVTALAARTEDGGRILSEELFEELLEMTDRLKRDRKAALRQVEQRDERIIALDKEIDELRLGSSSQKTPAPADKPAKQSLWQKLSQPRRS